MPIGVFVSTPRSKPLKCRAELEGDEPHPSATAGAPGVRLAMPAPRRHRQRTPRIESYTAGVQQ
jgi:hypothetical protein